MSQAFDLATSIASGLSATPGIVHDPHSPLVIGHPETGEFLVLAYDPVTRTAELTSSSDDINLSSTLSFDPNGNLLINGQPLASVGGVEDAVASANAAADAAQASAAAAGSSALKAEAASEEVKLNIDDFNTSANTVLLDMQAQADRAETASGQTDNIIAESSAYAAAAATSAGDAATARDEAAARAAADTDFIFDDGTKSARGYAQDAANSAQTTRVAAYRMLVAADFPETFQASKLFTRARVQNNAANIVNIGPNIWTSGAGEAWATYRLESAGSVRFVPAGGTTTTVAPGVDGLANTVRLRGDNPVALSANITGTVTPPVGYYGRIVILAMYAVNANAAYTVSCSFSGGITSYGRRSPTSPGAPDWIPQGVVYDGFIDNWPGGALTYSLLFTPSPLYFACKGYLVSNSPGGDTPIVGYACPGVNNGVGFASASVTLPGVASQSLVLSMAMQRRPVSVFTSWSNNLTMDVKGNLLGAGPAPPSLDSNTYRNASYGFGTGIAGGAGNFAVTANFVSAEERPAVMAIAYGPSVGASNPLVTMIPMGGRDTLTELGAEAELWFAPDGKHVFLQIPKP